MDPNKTRNTSRALGQEESLTDRLRRISNSFYDQFQPVNDWRYWVEEIFETYLIAADNDETKFYAVDYEIGEDDVSFTARDDWQEIEKVWSPVTDDERSLLVELIGDGKLAVRCMLPSGDGEAAAPPEVRPSARAFEPVICDYKPNVRASGDGKRSTFLIATDEVARDGAIVDIDGVDVTHYMRNPVVYWDHGRDPQRGRRPIAKCVDIKKRTIDGVKQLLATVEWNTDDFSQDIKRDVENGFINMTSLAWLGRPTARREVEIDGENYSVPVFEKSEMIEFSIVGVGTDRNALAITRDFDELKNELLTEVRAIIRGEGHGARANGSGAEEATVSSDEARGSDEPGSSLQGGAAMAASAPEGTEQDDTSSRSAPEVPESESHEDEPPVPAQRELGEADYARIAAQVVPRVLVGMRGELKTLVRRQLGKE